jgi:hypothetical protein
MHLVDQAFPQARTGVRDCSLLALLVKRLLTDWRNILYLS